MSRSVGSVDEEERELFRLTLPIAKDVPGALILAALGCHPVTVHFFQNSVQHSAMSVCLARQLLVAPTSAYLTERWQARAVTKKLSSSSKTSSSIMGWYEHHLQTRPLPTKMVTGGCLWGIGDIVAQSIPHVSSNSTGGAFQWDAARTSRAAFFGLAMHAPTSHVHFNLLEWMTQKLGLSGLSIPVFKTFMEQVRSCG